jgi:muramoyltetrapeptide carboxypeptidase
MVAKDFSHTNGIDPNSWAAALSGQSQWSVNSANTPGIKTLVNGEAEGFLYGGCLSMLVASLGTPYEIQTAGSILFIEDIGAKPYQVDRMLVHLKLAGKFNDVRGIIFGEMLDCVQHTNQGYSLDQVVMRIVGDLGIPVAYGLRSGHVSRENITLPIGVRVALSVKSGEMNLEFLEAATTP